MRRSFQPHFWLSLLLAVWAGLVIGISFIEAPLKFQAPGITRELGLGIGRLVFGALNKTEMGLLAVVSLLTLLGFAQLKIGFRLTFLAFFLLVAFQLFFLLPILDDRAVRLLAGEPLAPSWHHLVYGILEAAKVVLLFSLFALSYGRRAA
ncbi:MAG: hypothetical protein AAF555_01970 [Verrucomicrobiota bacterium]